jgi:hypothetical protein
VSSQKFLIFEYQYVYRSACIIFCWELCVLCTFWKTEVIKDKWMLENCCTVFYCWPVRLNSVQSGNHMVNTVNIPHAFVYLASDGMDAKSSVISFSCWTFVVFVAFTLFHKTPDTVNPRASSLLVLLASQ